MVKLHFNEASLCHIARQRTADREGRLQYRTSKDSYRERWFRLCGNLLFYFRTDERGAAEGSDPVGVLVLAACRVQTEAFGDRPFVFSISFEGEDRKHFFGGQSQQQCEQWVQALRRCLYSELRKQAASLRQQIERRTGSDPSAERPKADEATKPGSTHSLGAAKFYVDPVSIKQASVAVSAVASQGQSQGRSPLLPTRRAPGRPPEQLIELTDVAQMTDDGKKHRDATFYNWEKFN